MAYDLVTKKSTARDWSMGLGSDLPQKSDQMEAKIFQIMNKTNPKNPPWFFTMDEAIEELTKTKT